MRTKNSFNKQVKNYMCNGCNFSGSKYEGDGLQDYLVLLGGLELAARHVREFGESIRVFEKKVNDKQMRYLFVRSRKEIKRLATAVRDVENIWLEAGDRSTINLSQRED